LDDILITYTTVVTVDSYNRILLDAAIAFSPLSPVNENPPGIRSIRFSMKAIHLPSGDHWSGWREINT